MNDYVAKGDSGKRTRGKLVQAVVPPEVEAWLKGVAAGDGLSISATICRILVRARSAEGASAK